LHLESNEELGSALVEDSHWKKLLFAHEKQAITLNSNISIE
jgi:hypothetical protein